MRRLAVLPAFIVFLSGYGPLGLIFVVKDINLISAPYVNHPWLLLVVLSCLLFSMWFTRWHFKFYKKDEPLKVIEIEDKSTELLSYSIPYIAGFSGVAIGNTGEMLAVALVIWVVFNATYRTQSVVVNPFILSLNYRMQSAILEYRGGERQKVTIITNQIIEKNITYRFQKISEFCFVRNCKKER